MFGVYKLRSVVCLYKRDVVTAEGLSRKPVDWNWQRVGVNWLSNDHLGPLSNGNAAPVGLQWTSAFNLDVPRVHLAKLRRLVSPSGCHRTSLALNWLYKTLLEWV